MSNSANLDTPIDVPQNLTLQLALRMLESVHIQVRVADDKIRALFGATALLAAALAFAGQAPSYTRPNGLTLMEAAGLVARAALLLAVVYSVVSAVLALLPRVDIQKRERSMFFFGDVASTDHDVFLREFGGLTERDAIVQVLSQIHVVSQIVRTKYVWTSRAASGFLVATIVWIIVLILRFLS